jgi:hypothetical protein
MARAVEVKYVCVTNHSLMVSLMYHSLSIHSQMMELFGDNSQRGNGAIFVHKHLLSERSTFFKDLIDKKEIESYNKVPNEDDDVDDDGYDNRHLVVELVDTGQRACIKLVRWLYGQPMLDPNKPHRWDLSDVAEIYHISCIENEASSTWDTECMEACFDAMKQLLTQTERELKNPIEMIDGVLKDTRRPGSAVMLRQLAYGACAADGRTKTWLDEYCDYDDRESEIIELICLEFAKKVSGQSN